jgi:hypothetical protein
MQEISGLGSRIADALRVAAFIKVPEERMRASWVEIMAAAFLALCVPTAYALIAGGGDGTFASRGVHSALLFVPVFLFGVAIVARIARRDDAVPTMLFATLLAWAVIDAISLSIWAALTLIPESDAHPLLGSVFFYGPLAWLALAVARFASVTATVTSGRQAAVLAASAAFLAFPMAYLQPQRSLWVEDWSKRADTGRDAWAAADEQAFYRQPDLLAQELAAVKKGRPGIVDVFFIGMAGYGYQDVFMREVDAVARLMRERFGAEGHVVKLVNNSKTVMSSPIASLTSLREALRRTATQMDVEEDVLVLFLTSHGSAEHRFSLDLYPFRFKQIDPATLRQALDDSGIRNRIVIISACYAGGFAGRLQDPNTLVIAAAAPDRNSFGCSNEADWTYFGKAYFDEALRQTHSFTRAFEMAAPAIELREKSGNHEPSKPVMVVGAAIGETLARLERQLASPATPEAEASLRAVSSSKDAIDRYVDLSFDERHALEFTRACRDSMRLSSPDAWLDKDSKAFGGMDRSSRHWPRLAMAWERHSEEFCRKANDAGLIRSIYAEQVRAVMSDGELDPILAFLSTDAGKRWFDKEREVVRRQVEILSRKQAEISDVTYRTYVDDQAKIVAAFRKDREGGGKNGRLDVSNRVPGGS